MLWLHGNDSVLRTSIFLALGGIPYKYNQCHTTLGGLTSVCEIRSGSSNNNEILDINVLQKFTLHVLSQSYGLFQKISSLSMDDTELGT